MSPGSETFSHSQLDPHIPARNGDTQSVVRAVPDSNGKYSAADIARLIPPNRKPKNCFDFYCNEVRRGLLLENLGEWSVKNYDIERKMAEGWQSFSAAKKDEYYKLFLEAQKKDVPAERGGTPTPNPSASQPVEDEDVEMAEEHDSPSGTAEATS